MILIKNDKLYDKLKFLAQILLPALGTLYFALAGIWGLPGAEKAVGTILAVDTFLGVILQLSSTAYAKTEERFDGSINVMETPDTKTFELELKDHPEILENRKELLFKVNPPA